MSIWMFFMIIDILCGSNHSSGNDDLYMTDYYYDDDFFDYDDFGL